MDWASLLTDHWQIKFVTAVLLLAAWIDGKALRVPNWITYPMAFSGLAYWTYAAGWSGLGESFVGLLMGLACLLPLYAVGGMGAGDVKLMAGMGAWVGASITWNAFCVSVVVGAIMAVCMVLYRRDTGKHLAQAMMIWTEWKTIRNPRKLAAIAAERKPRMFLLPYGIPICIGSIAYFAYAGLY